MAFLVYKVGHEHDSLEYFSKLNCFKGRSTGRRLVKDVSIISRHRGPRSDTLKASASVAEM